MAGLLGLAEYARAEDALIAPFGSGCSTLVTYPLAEGKRALPRAVLGIFDPSARPDLAPEELSFAAPLALWEEILGNAEDSFHAWRLFTEENPGSPVPRPPAFTVAAAAR